MLRLKMEVVAALAAWSIASVCETVPVSSHWTRGLCPRSNDVNDLGIKLSPTAKVYYPGSEEFDVASTRWSVLDAPKVNIVVVPGTENDVVETVKYANEKGLPFLAYNGAHGAITTLGKMDHGIEIFLEQLNTIDIAEDGKTVKIGGGTGSKAVTDTLWAAGKQTVSGTCECVSFLGPALGGGHGWLQGHHGLVADQFVSMNIVLADGSLKVLDNQSDLWWAMNGAGHNFGIVTSVTTKLYDVVHSDWAIETLIFSGDKVEAVYQAANDYLLKNGTQPEGVINWSYWLNIPDADPENPVILFYIIQEGVTAVDSVYTKPFHDIGPLSEESKGGSYTDLAGWTGISLSAPPCQKAGLVNPRFPNYLEEYNVPAQKEAYKLFANGARGSSPFNNSIFMFEGYSTQGVKAIDSKSSAFAFRGENILSAPLITYAPAGPELDTKASQLGNELRQILHKASGQPDVQAYVNYAYGDETPQQWYGSEKWRQDRLQALKQKYDPTGKFSFFAPIA
ncbi:FAD-dependent oxygenase [Aspergillus nomiae NRRL 13137]|uniref:FAD-dependent oxygenase n=1 Tax=Aspergillus nomiae NRRL (strain ATCC 15546 / NRRL 13137 / CBS 260.88 / M93) TaxID=1509407 RepID=A0A0L1JHI0_ASPN3|nr:FAD-dependent oxygenase [Aspergillus nomiae NRRL 13137]KNG91157.1 FAD-dependent oxygenase [Aspergillus nomiae NRRL 13137]